MFVNLKGWLSISDAEQILTYNLQHYEKENYEKRRRYKSHSTGILRSKKGNCFFPALSGARQKITSGNL